MRYRILASFQGAPYEAGVGPDESDVVLFAACPPPEELRFEPATGHWRKRVSREQVQTLYESRPVGMFRGEPCVVLDDLSDRLHIVYLGHDAIRAAQLGYWEVDRGVFELITPRHEVTDIVEQRHPLPIRSDSGQHTKPGPMPSDRPDDISAGRRNGVAYGAADSQPIGFGGGYSSGGYGSGGGYGGRDEFGTGPQFFGQRESLDGQPPSYSQDHPTVGLSRPEPTVARSADPSEVAIPPVPEPPLPLEAEALRAASSAARRGQKGGQSRQPQDARAARRSQPAVAPEVQAPTDSVPQPAATAAVQAPQAAATAAVQAPQPEASAALAPQAASAPVQAPQAPQAPPPPVTQQPAVAPQPPSPAPVPVPASTAPTPPAQAPQLPPPPSASAQAADVSQPLPAPMPAAATLSKAAMLSAAAATAAHRAAPSSKRESQPRPGITAKAARAAAPATAPPPSQGPEQPASTPEPELTAPAIAQVTPEPAPVAAEPTPVAAEPALGAAEPAPKAVGVPAVADAALAGQAAEAAAQVDQPPSELVSGTRPGDAQAPGYAAPHQDVRSDMPAATAAPTPAPAFPAAAALAPAPAPSAETAPAHPAPAHPAPAHPAQATPAPAEGPANTPLPGISDPPSVTYQPPASAVPSWTPQGPMQAQPDFEAAPPVEPAPDAAPPHAGYYAPYVLAEPPPHNGTSAAANGTSTPADFRFSAPMPIQQPGLLPPSTFLTEPGPVPPSDEISEPATDAGAADPGSTTRRRRSTKRRLPTQQIFSDLATAAAIPGAAYAIGEDVDGAMCLMRTDEGFEVFNSAAGARHEVRVFQDEESAYFYLFGVLVAESVRTGALVPRD